MNDDFIDFSALGWNDEKEDAEIGEYGKLLSKEKCDKLLRIAKDKQLSVNEAMKFIRSFEEAVAQLAILELLMEDEIELKEWKDDDAFYIKPGNDEKDDFDLKNFRN